MHYFTKVYIFFCRLALSIYIKYVPLILDLIHRICTCPFIGELASVTFCVYKTGFRFNEFTVIILASSLAFSMSGIPACLGGSASMCIQINMFISPWFTMFTIVTCWFKIVCLLVATPLMWMGSGVQPRITSRADYGHNFFAPVTLSQAIL